MGIQGGDKSQVWKVAYNIYEWPINILGRGWKWDEMRGKKQQFLTHSTGCCQREKEEKREKERYYERIM